MTHHSTSAKVKHLTTVLGAGLTGALLAYAIGLPIPFLLGSMAATALLSIARYATTGERFWFPMTMRRIFIATIGTMIGTTFGPDALALAPNLVITLSAMVLFIAAAQLLNFTIFHRLGGYDRVTARYAAMPGGLIEAVALGEKAGGDVATLSIQHFVRIVLVIVTVPLLFQIVSGTAVGSAAGETLETAPPDWVDWALFLVLVPGGLGLGNLLRLPAAHLIGPLILTATLQSLNVIDLHGPALLLNLAQLVVGAGLGTNFARTTPRHLLSAFSLGAVSVGLTLCLAAGIAHLLQDKVPMSFAALFISFAPGGVTEMSLVALSLGVTPVLVTTHHLFRIMFTVTVAGMLTARTNINRKEP